MRSPDFPSLGLTDEQLPGWGSEREETKQQVRSGQATKNAAGEDVAGCRALSLSLSSGKRVKMQTGELSPARISILRFEFVPQACIIAAIF